MKRHKPKKLNDIERITAEADKLGLSYGKYVSQLKQEKENARKKPEK